MNKYRNKITTVDGFKFHSKKEAKRYSELLMMQKAGLISDLELQPKFQIIPEINWGDKKLSAKYYIADFAYTENGKEIVEDVKGVKTPVYILKRQLFIITHPEFVFRET